ncbi:MAG: class I SAM-dependent methyltransferase [Elusimicrobia bacterium]|nr:class I SAM-dependent methyltransferase [Elusimicrobiota bacterium]
MNVYERFVLPYLIDLACGQKDITEQRLKVVPRARGCVLEVGIGTGLNVPHYDRRKVERVVALDPAVQMHRLAARRIKQHGLPVELMGLSAESIPAPDASFDSAVMTYTLCSIPEPNRALRELRRVLKPGAPLLFCEHGRAPDEGVRRWQDRLDPFWGVFAGGCHLNRDVPALLAEAGFATASIESGYLPGPRLLTYHFWGEAS